MADIQHIYTGTAPPAAAPAGIGHHYIDTTNKKAYLAVGTASITDWVDVSAGGGGGGGSEKSLYPVNSSSQTFNIQLNSITSFDYVAVDTELAEPVQYNVNLYLDSDSYTTLNTEQHFFVRLPPLQDGSHYRITGFNGEIGNTQGGFPAYKSTDEYPVNPSLIAGYVDTPVSVNAQSGENAYVEIVHTYAYNGKTSANVHTTSAIVHYFTWEEQV